MATPTPPSDRRWVKVDAVVLVAETEGPQDQAAAYEAVGKALLDLARVRKAGGRAGLLPIDAPLLTFTASSGPGRDIPDKHPV